MSDLISKKTRIGFREYFVTTSLREISQEFDGADVPLDKEYQSPETGQRRSLVEKYYHATDFSSWRDVQKVLRVYEIVMLNLEERIKNPLSGNKDEYAERSFSVLKSSLERDGFVYSQGRITQIGHKSAIKQLTQTAQNLDSHLLKQQIERLHSSIDNDPDLAIGTAKELLETTCKTILADYGITPNTSWDVTQLAKETRQVLLLVPEDIPDSAKGSEIIKRVLGNLGQISQGLAELRNLYGTGHGKKANAKGLSARHARLAVACSTALATFLFETHEVRRQSIS